MGKVYQLIKANRAQFPARILCETLGVSHSGHYDWAKRTPSFGTILDFSYQGEVVRIDNTLPGFPAQQAGLQQGDILIQLAG